MAKIYTKTTGNIKEYDIDLNDDIFKQILELRKNYLYDRERFFLNYISDEDLSKCNFNDEESLEQFSNDTMSKLSPIKGMAGCNQREEMLSKGIRYAGNIISDPNKNVLGQFDIIDNTMIYSPIFPYFYEERDLIKFARDEYFTTIPFDVLALNQIKYVKKCLIYTGKMLSLKELANSKYGYYAMEKVSKTQMKEFIKDPEQGRLLKRKFIESEIGKN